MSGSLLRPNVVDVVDEFFFKHVLCFTFGLSSKIWMVAVDGAQEFDQPVDRWRFLVGYTQFLIAFVQFVSDGL